MKSASVTIFLLFFPASVPAWWFGPSTYDEYVTKYGKVAKSELGVRAVMFTCCRQFIQCYDSWSWKRFYSCVRDAAEDTNNSKAFRIARNECVEKHKPDDYVLTAA